MNPKQLSLKSARILYDADVMAAPEPRQFVPAFWENRDAVIARPGGRGGTVVMRYPAGEAVLKRYFRGGLVARVNRQGYLFTGYERSRAWREFRLLAWMRQQGLPVPQPLAALVERRAGLFARLALMTGFLPATRSLGECLRDHRDIGWRRVGATIAAFHRRGVCHADLNIDNILIDSARRIFLIDFDKCSRRKPETGWQQQNLRRLRRSLRKLLAGGEFPGIGWQELLEGYDKELKNE